MFDKTPAQWKRIVTGPLTDVQQARHRLLKNRQWFNANIKQLCRDYPDGWIAVCDEKVVKVGKGYDEVAKEVHAKWRPDEALIVKVPFEPEAIYTPV